MFWDFHDIRTNMLITQSNTYLAFSERSNSENFQEAKDKSWDVEDDKSPYYQSGYFGLE